jgi:hypothetical protein
MPRFVRRLILLPLVLLAAPIYQHFHSTHSWLEGKIRDNANSALAPDSVANVSCDVQGSSADCRFTTKANHAFSVHVTKRGDTWTPDRAIQVS